ncbi:putative coiled-coil domain-containing protein [Apostichopus japonicus]|uniref:Putative coiled-coil domain-containing protein n=1 Tax=Stichopus japonicus TaxID=307972 RepID=A0A2G8LIL1_STIJA|nr:putative coiled-coil domain-containing protein [Apostichopus japonicus]
MMTRLRDFAKLYDVIKNERNKCVNLIQASTQKAAEMREKIKILQNEIEILRTSCHGKKLIVSFWQFQKAKLKHVNAIVLRDQLRNELAKQQRIESEMQQQLEQQRLDIAKLNLMINQAEEQMVRLRTRFKAAVQHRNDRGVQLIERHEEVCLFYEKVNIQEDMIRRGDVDLHTREEEIRFLKMQVGEEKRAIDLLRKNVPNKRALDQELVTLQIQLSQCQDRMTELEKNLENPYDETRVRFLEGEDPQPQISITKLKIALHETSGGSKAPAEVRQQESALEQAYLRMEQGEAPSEEAAREWERLIRDELRKKSETEERRMMAEEEEQFTLPGGMVTTAEPRPNAYIPDDDSDLPVPRPYGGHAPFKPTQAGANMRHIRKPVIKPIEI